MSKKKPHSVGEIDEDLLAFRLTTGIYTSPIMGLDKFLRLTTPAPQLKRTSSLYKGTGDTAKTAKNEKHSRDFQEYLDRIAPRPEAPVKPEEKGQEKYQAFLDKIAPRPKATSKDIITKSKDTSSSSSSSSTSSSSDQEVTVSGATEVDMESTV